MELPSTSPSGRNPASRTSRNSLTDRSEVKMAPGLPGVSSAKRASASWGTPAALSSVEVWSVIVLLGSASWTAPYSGAQLDPGGLAALRVQRQDRQAGPLRGARPGVEASDSGTDEGGLDDVVTPAFGGRAVTIPHLGGYRGHDHAVGAKPRHVLLELLTCVVAGVGHHLGIAMDFGVPRPPAGLGHGEPVVMAGPDRDAEHQARGHPAVHEQLGEVLAGQVGGERPRQRRARPADRGAERLELQAAGRKGPDAKGDADDAVAAERGAFRRHPV